MGRGQSYDWKCFWCPTDGSINLIDSGYLADPDQPYSRHLNPALCTFGQLSDIACLALLGEPGIGKTETLRAERSAIDAAVEAEGVFLVLALVLARAGG